jgi:uncharacterized protein (DUF2132 family)
MGMKNPEKHNILDGVTLKSILEELVENFGFEELGERIDIRCFTTDASISSSLKFLRKTPWARTKVEKLYVELKKKN